MQEPTPAVVSAGPPVCSAPLGVAHRKQLEQLVAGVGERAALRQLSVSRTTLYRGLAGLPLNGSTRVCIATALDGKR